MIWFWNGGEAIEMWRLATVGRRPARVASNMRWSWSCEFGWVAPVWSSRVSSEPYPVSSPRCVCERARESVSALADKPPLLHLPSSLIRCSIHPAWLLLNGRYESQGNPVTFYWWCCSAVLNLFGCLHVSERASDGRLLLLFTRSSCSANAPLTAHEVFCMKLL